MNYLHLIIRTQRHPSAILLMAQLLGMVLYPFIEHTNAGRIAFNAFGVVILIITTGMVRRTPGLAWVSACIAAPAIVLLGLQAMFDMPQLLPWSSALEAVFYFYAAASLTAYMMEDHRVTTDELFAAGATFTLLAWGFTHLFILVQALHPGSYGAAVNAADPRTWTELMYLSFALLSSTGIGDVIPLTTLARSLASIEMFAGLMYLALVVSRLVAMTVQARK